MEIDFRGFDLACISGENGAGKSSILDAVTWVLFGRARRNDESLINLDSKTAIVSLVFDYEGNQYRVVRTNPRGETKQLELFIRKDQSESSQAGWEPLTERTLRETDQIIIEILRLDYESFVNASFLLQGDADLFTQQNPSTRKRILSQILGLEIWEIYRKRTASKRKAAESDVDRLDGRLAEINTELEEESQRKNQLSELEKDLSQARLTRKKAEDHLAELQTSLGALDEQKKLILALESQVGKITHTINELEKKAQLRESERKELEAVLQDAERITLAYQDWQAAQRSLAEWEIVAEQFRESEIKRQEPLLQIAAEKARLLQAQSSLESRYSELVSSQKDLPGLSKQLAEIQTAIQDAETRLETRESKVQDLDGARQDQSDAKAENPLLFQEMKDLEKRIADLEVADGALCPLCGQELSQADRLKLIQSLKDNGKDLGDRYRINQATLQQADRVVKELQLQITELSLTESSLRELSKEADQLNNAITSLNEQQNAWDKTHQLELAEIQRGLNSETFAEEARQQLKTLNAKLKKIGYDADEHDRVRDLTNQAGLIQDQKAALDRTEATLKPLAREIKELQDQISSEQKDLVDLAAELERGRQALETGKENAPDTSQLENQLLDFIEQEKVLEREVGAAQQKVAVLETQKSRKSELESRREEVSQSVKLYKQLESAFGKDGVPALLIEQALPNIEAKANQILDKLSGGTMSIRFLTQREYKDSGRDDLKETLDIQIRDLAGYRDYELYSGGESFRINFAIRLALSHVLAQRAGARLQTLVIDEGFGSQDAIGRQRLIEAINLVQDDFEKILVITHVEQIKETFSTQIQVEKTPRGSQVSLV